MADLQCEAEISNAWFVPDNDRIQLGDRAEAAIEVDVIAKRLATMEKELVQEMQEAEQDVTTYHPAPEPESSDDSDDEPEVQDD